MAKPTLRAWEMLKRIGRYLKGWLRLIWKYGWQCVTSLIDAHSDADWAVC